jgi:hypothetical protein
MTDLSMFVRVIIDALVRHVATGKKRLEHRQDILEWLDGRSTLLSPPHAT